LIIDNDEAQMTNGGGGSTYHGLSYKFVCKSRQSTRRLGQPELGAGELHWNFNLKVMFYENYKSAKLFLQMYIFRPTVDDFMNVRKIRRKNLMASYWLA
jgi:hypothetical protein